MEGADGRGLEGLWTWLYLPSGRLWVQSLPEIPDVVVLLDILVGLDGSKERAIKLVNGSYADASDAVTYVA